MKVELKRQRNEKGEKLSSFVDAPLIQIVDRQPERDGRGNIVRDEFNRIVMTEAVYRLSNDPKVEGAVTEFEISNDEYHAKMIQDLKNQVKPTKRRIQTFDQASKRVVSKDIEDVTNIGRYIELSDLPEDKTEKKK